jgi:hypothetical protein
MGEVRNQVIFNSPTESALRTLLIIDEVKSLNIDKLIIFDYLCLNTEDFNGPSSIHAPVPNRNVQILIRREVIKDGLKILVAKELVKVKAQKTGIFYAKSPLTTLFLSHMTSAYKTRLHERVKWVTENFGEWSETKLKKFVKENIEHWSSEITSDITN